MMVLVDSNILIYASKPEYPGLVGFIESHAPAVSAVSYVEVLGYPNLPDRERQFFEAFFATATMLPISDAVLDRAVGLRRLKKMKLGDALIAGTAVAHGHALATRNTKDFDRIDGLTLIDPFAGS